LIGVAGDCKDGDEWLDWHKGGRRGKPPKPKNPDEFSALILRKAGLFSVTEGAHEMKIDRGFHAIGSGGACAIAAYIAIKRTGIQPDPRLCVQIAAEVDSSTGGRIIVHKLKA
jgi:ATP-dependent protease HslVU (ClpYQ) peptidase subunit